MGKTLLGSLLGPPGPQGPAGTMGPWDPSDSGLLAANGDPFAAQGQLIMTAGVVYLMKVRARSAITVAKINFGITVAGLGASSGSFVGLYSPAGALLSSSADIGSLYLLSTGPKSPSLLTAEPIAAGNWAWAAILSNLATTQPTLATGTQTPNSFTNFNEAVQTARFGQYGSGLTSLPSTLTLSSITFSNNSNFCGFS